ncbi:thioredoxin-dependent thiol peroxidase [Porticoccaceae bacterium]|jgi:peroxiredoxin Q/BCP|nr:thioredoxin-dependent thiol peroxidase [Porticoccaceae bacterium]MDB9737445.1 thioredoxin-dependent thiol peroxidase [Porticoccaceae bacterium]MDB9949330.1 thioredoxin-dependent thiol peroxidase [Porticoccaceae bacterium]MDC1512806.1 thioredoxin-dependent thiol peroxidase [Porticoccaceae bacterium]
MAFSEVGTAAKDFSLFSQRGEKVSLADFRGVKNVLLYFYPKAMTPGCTVQACGIRDSKDQFAELDTVVMAVSPDSVDRLVKFEDKQELNFTLLSDEDHQVTESYGAWDMKKFMGREYMGVLRSSFVIGKDGLIKHVMAKVKTKTHHDDALAWIKENL